MDPTSLRTTEIPGEVRASGASEPTQPHTTDPHVPMEQGSIPLRPGELVDIATVEGPKRHIVITPPHGDCTGLFLSQDGVLAGWPLGNVCWRSGSDPWSGSPDLEAADQLLQQRNLEIAQLRARVAELEEATASSLSLDTAERLCGLVKKYEALTDRYVMHVGRYCDLAAGRVGA